MKTSSIEEKRPHSRYVRVELVIALCQEVTTSLIKQLLMPKKERKIMIKKTEYNAMVSRSDSIEEHCNSIQIAVTFNVQNYEGKLTNYSVRQDSRVVNRLTGRLLKQFKKTKKYLTGNLSLRNTTQTYIGAKNGLQHYS